MQNCSHFCLHLQDWHEAVQLAFACASPVCIRASASVHAPPAGLAMQSLSTEQHQWKVLLDAAAFVPTQPLDLSACPADFVAVSFYKMMGYPGGVGALLVRRLQSYEWAGI